MGKSQSKKKPLTIHYAIQENLPLPLLEKTIKSQKTQINRKNSKGETPLRLAFQKPKNYNTIKLLIKNGADLNEKSWFGKTPLFFALENNCDFFVFELLLNFVAKIEEKNDEEKNVFFLALEKKNFDLNIIFLFLRKCPDLRRNLEFVILKKNLRILKFFEDERDSFFLDKRYKLNLFHFFFAFDFLEIEDFSYVFKFVKKFDYFVK